MGLYGLRKRVVVTEYDDQGRITRPAGNVHGGHSVCNICGKDMPKCWNTVCSRCGRTFCYVHSVEIDSYWVCTECAGMSEEEIFQKEIDHCKEQIASLKSAQDRWRRMRMPQDAMDDLSRDVVAQTERLEELIRERDSVLHT